MVPDQAVPSPAGDEYELVPRSQLEYLQREVEKLKKNPFGDSGTAKDMLTAVDTLTKSIQKMNAIFETANDEIVRDYKDKANTEKINLVLEQNEKLAKGIVAIADLLRELKDLKAQSWATAAPPPPSLTPAPAEPQINPAQLPPEWQSVMGAPPMGSGQNANPFLDQSHSFAPAAAPQQGFGPQSYPQAAPQQGFGQGYPQAAPPGQPRKLPPIDFSEVPPPPPRR